MREEEEEEPKWWDPNQELSLPTPEELIPISQTLIPTDLALAFDIISTDPNNNNSNSKRPRLVWTPHLHRRFVDSVAQLGIKNAVPKAIMQLMGVDGLTRENVASHLQKYRQYLKRIGSGLGCGGGDPAMDRLFSSSPVPALFLQQTGCVKAVGTVGELVFRPEGYRGVGENGSVLDRNLDRSFQMGQSQQSSSDKRDNLSPFSAVGKVQDLRIGKEGYRRVAENGSGSDRLLDRSFQMGQSQQSCSDKQDNLSPFSAVGMVQDLRIGKEAYRRVAENGSGSDRLLDRSFQMGQSQQSCSDKQDNLSPFSAVGMVQDLRIGKEAYRRVAENGSGSDRLLDRSFQMGQSQQSCSDKQDNLSPFSAVGRVQELGFGTKGFRGVGENGSVSNLVSERSFLMGQFQQSNSNDRQKMWPLSAMGSIREVGFGTEGFQGVGENGLVSNLAYDRSFMMGQSQQSSTNRDNLSPFSAVGMVQELGFRGVGGNESVSNLVSERSFFMGQSQQSNTNRENLSPFSAVGPVQELGFRGMGANGSGSNGLFDRSLQMGRFQMYGSSPLYVDEMASGDSGGGRRVLTLFPTREED